MMRFLLILPLLLSMRSAQAGYDLATTRVFHADISAAHMTVYTQSGGAGEGEFVLDLATLTVSYNVAFKGLTTAPTSVWLHGPAHPGTNAPRMVDLARGGKPASPLRGKVKVTESQVQYMLQGWVYIVIATEKNPAGEIRGKFDTVPPY